MVVTFVLLCVVPFVVLELIFYVKASRRLRG